MMHQRKRIMDRARSTVGSAKRHPWRTTGGAAAGVAAVLLGLQATGTVNTAEILTNFGNVSVDNSVTTDNSENFDNSQNIEVNEGDTNITEGDTNITEFDIEIVQIEDVWVVEFPDETTGKYESVERAQEAITEWKRLFSSSSDLSAVSPSSTEPVLSPTGVKDDASDDPDAIVLGTASADHPTPAIAAIAVAPTATPTLSTMSTATSTVPIRPPTTSVNAPVETPPTLVPADERQPQATIPASATPSPIPVIPTETAPQESVEPTSTITPIATATTTPNPTTSPVPEPTLESASSTPEPAVDRSEWDYRHDCLYSWRTNVITDDGGIWIDGYTGLSYIKDVHGNPHLDHVIPKAWGLAQFSDEEMWDEFKCDTDNIVFTTSELNLAKSDKLPVEWIPALVALDTEVYEECVERDGKEECETYEIYQGFTYEGQKDYCATVALVVERYEFEQIECAPVIPAFHRDGQVALNAGLALGCSGGSVVITWVPLPELLPDVEGGTALIYDNFDWWNETYGNKEYKNLVIEDIVFWWSDDPGEYIFSADAGQVIDVLLRRRAWEEEVDYVERASCTVTE